MIQEMIMDGSITLNGIFHDTIKRYVSELTKHMNVAVLQPEPVTHASTPISSTCLGVPGNRDENDNAMTTGSNATMKNTENEVVRQFEDPELQTLYTNWVAGQNRGHESMHNHDPSSRARYFLLPIKIEALRWVTS